MKSKNAKAKAILNRCINKIQKMSQEEFKSTLEEKNYRNKN